MTHTQWRTNTRNEYSGNKKTTTVTTEMYVDGVLTNTETKVTVSKTDDSNRSDNTNPTNSQTKQPENDSVGLADSMEKLSLGDPKTVAGLLSSNQWWYEPKMNPNNPALKFKVIPASDELKRQTLLWHNKYRRLHGVPDLIWSDEAYECASRWAQHLAEQRKGLVHSEKDYRHGFGENLAWGRRGTSGKANTFEYTVDQGITSWYDEIQDYDYENHCSKNGNAVGHFTQVIWKDTLAVGMAVAMVEFVEDGWTIREAFAVANYISPGNITGWAPQQVLPLIKQ